MGLFDDMLLSYISLLLQLCLPWQTGKRAPWQQRLLSQRVLQKPPAPHLQPADELTGNFLGADSMFRSPDAFTHLLAITKILQEIKENFVPFVLFIPSQALGKFHSIGFLIVKRKSGETQP